MKDITMYSDRELSLIVMNDQYLYNCVLDNTVLDKVKKFFIYTPEQYEDLLVTIDETLEEHNNWRK